MKAIRFDVIELGVASRVTQQTSQNFPTDPNTTISSDLASCTPAEKLCRATQPD